MNGWQFRISKQRIKYYLVNQKGNGVGYLNSLTNCPILKGFVPNLMKELAEGTKHRHSSLICEDLMHQTLAEVVKEEAHRLVILYHQLQVLLEVLSALQRWQDLQLEDPPTTHLKIQYFFSVSLRPRVSLSSLAFSKWGFSTREVVLTNFLSDLQCSIDISINSFNALSLNYRVHTE